MRRHTIIKGWLWNWAQGDPKKRHSFLFKNLLSSLRMALDDAIYQGTKNYLHHHPESEKRNSSEGNSGPIHPDGRHEYDGELSKPYLPYRLSGLSEPFSRGGPAMVEVGVIHSPVYSSKKQLKSQLVWKSSKGEIGKGWGGVGPVKIGVYLSVWLFRQCFTIIVSSN